MNSIVVIQARLNSTRLPAKALLPIAGFPMVVLAAKRIANTGRDVIVATSQTPSDDPLCQTLENNNLPFFRGSLNDTLLRFVTALEKMSDDTVVFRLTADNVFPDGKFLDEMEAHFLKNNLRYLSSTGAESGLPYGMSAEMMYLSDLREANETTTSTHDREHVTPFVIRKHGKPLFTKHAKIQMSHFRCTVDNFDDYLSLNRVFCGDFDPINVSWQKLVKILPDAPMQPKIPKPATGMVLGTVQLGLAYGITSAGQITDDEKVNLVRAAISNGVESLDTAQAYGNSEQVIGHALKGGWASRTNVVTKVSPLAKYDKNSTREVVQLAVENSIYRSCRNLDCDKLDTVLLHRSDHLHEWDGAVLERLEQFVSNGVIKRLGVSVQSPEELERALEYSAIEHIQLPFNILDTRWAGVIRLLIEAKNQRKITVHARSALLQGLLTSTNNSLWQRALIENGDEISSWLSKLVNEFDRKGLVDLCVGFVKAQPWIDAVVLGADNMDQLLENAQLVSNKELSGEQLAKIESSRPQVNIMALDPSNWRTS